MSEPISKPSPPRPSGQPPNGRPPRTATAPTQHGGISRGLQTAAHKIAIFGGAGIGKSALAANLSQVGLEPLFLDLESGTKFLDVARIEPATWDELRAVLHDSELLQPFGAVVIDSGTRAEELALAWTLANIKHEKGHSVTSIEGYGFGKGLTHLYETFMQLLGDLDAVARSGRHIVVICHDCVTTVPNPAGEDFVRWEPRLQSPASGKFSIRHRLREYVDHLFFIGYDVAVDTDGKGKGSGTRAIYTQERPSHMAKSRTLSETIIYSKGSADLWRALLNKENES